MATSVIREGRSWLSHICLTKRPHRVQLRILYENYVTNDEVRAKIKQAIGPHEDQTIVKRRKLQWYGHV